MSVNISLTHVLSGIIGFLLGSASVVNGAKKRNPLTVLIGLLFLLGSAYACFLALVSATVEEYEDEETEADEEESPEAVEEPDETPEPEKTVPETDEKSPEADA